MYDRLFQRKTENILSPRICCGRNFYAELKHDFFGSGSPTGFPDVPATDVEDPALFQCVKACIRHNRDFLPMITFLEASSKLSTLNLHAVLGTAMKVAPGGKRNECTEFLLDIMRFIVRVGHHDSHKDSVEVAKDHFDKALCKDLIHHRGDGGASSTWWLTRQSFAILVLPGDVTDQCMVKDAKATSLMVELKTLEDSSQVGKLLAHKTLRDAQRDVHMSIVQDTLHVLTPGALTLEIKDTNRQLFFTKCQEFGCSPTETRKSKDHEFHHLGVPFLIPVQSLLDTYNIAWECLVRTDAINAGVLDALWCEKELATDLDEKEAPDECLYKQTSLARDEMRKFLAGDDPTAKTNNDKYVEKLSYLCGIDKFAKIEMAYFCASAGQNGMKRVHDMILDKLPTFGQLQKTPAGVLACFQKDSNKKVLIFAGSAASTIYQKVTNLVKSIHEGSRPSFEGATEAGFMKDVMARLLNFAKLDVAAGSSDGHRSLVGKDAVQWQFQHVNKIEKPRHADLNMLVIFGWCLTKAENDQVTVWKKAAGDAPPAPPSGSSSSSAAAAPVKAGTTRAKDKAKHLDDMTKALFKR